MGGLGGGGGHDPCMLTSTVVSCVHAFVDVDVAVHWAVQHICICHADDSFWDVSAITTRQ